MMLELLPSTDSWSPDRQNVTVTVPQADGDTGEISLAARRR